MNRLSFRNYQLKLETLGELPIVLEESIEYIPHEWKQSRKMSTCHQLDLESPGSWLTMSKNFPGTNQEQKEDALTLRGEGEPLDVPHPRLKE